MIKNLPYPGQNYSKSGIRFVPDDNGPATLIEFVYQIGTDQVMGRFHYARRSSMAWLLPDGEWIRFSIIPTKRYHAVSEDRFVPSKYGLFSARGRYPHFVIPERGNQRVWLDYGRDLVTIPVDFEERTAEALRSQRRIEKQKSVRLTKLRNAR